MKDGKKEGQLKAFFETGEIQQIINYSNDTLDGISMNFYQTGTKEWVTIYTKGIKTENEKQYYQSGALKLSKPYSYGLIHGQIVEYYEDGRIMSIDEFNMGKRISPKLCFSPTGIQTLFACKDAILLIPSE